MYNLLVQPKVTATQTVECSTLPNCYDCLNCCDRDHELKDVKMQVTGLQDQLFSLNIVVEILNTVVESLYKV